MSDILIQFLHAHSGWEIAAVFLGICYLLLALRESIWCWPCALLSTAIYIWLFGNFKLYMESLLNIYYLLMAFYGFHLWRGGNNEDKSIRIQYWPWRHHLIAISCVVLLSLISGILLQNNTDAVWPFLDSFTTWGAVLTTFMVAKKIIENWIYWFIIDGLSILIYIERGLYPTATLFFIYEIIVIFGFFSWLQRYRQQNHHVSYA